MNIYYTVNKELQSVDDYVEETTGNKKVSAYVVNGRFLENLFHLEILNIDNSQTAIKEYLEDELNIKKYNLISI